MNFLFERASSLIVVILVVANNVDAGAVAGRSVMSWLRGSDEPVRAEETAVTGHKPILQVHRYNGVHIQPLLEPQPAAFLPPPLPAPVSEHIAAVVNMLYEAAPYMPEMEHLHEVEFARWQPYIQAISEDSFDRMHDTVEVEGEARVGLPSKAKILKFLQLLKEKKLKPIRDAYQMKKNLINSALNLLHPIPPPPPPPPSPPVAPTFYHAPSDAIVVEAAAPSVYDLPPPPPPPPSPVFVPHPSLHFASLPPPSMPHVVHHPVPEFPKGVQTFFEHPRFHQLADIPFPHPPPFIPVHLEEIHAHAHESPSMDVILGHDLHAEASENVEHFSPPSANATVPVARMEVVEESHINAMPTQNSTMPAVIATGESQLHERHSRSLDKYKYELPEPYILKPYSSRRPRSVPALTPLDESMQVEPTRRPPPSLEPLGEFTQLDDIRRPTRPTPTKPCGCKGPCKHDREARNLVDSAEFQDIRRPPPALEPLGELMELDDVRRPTRHVPDRTGPAIHPIIIHRPPPALEQLTELTELNDTSRPKRHVVDSRRPVDYIGYGRHLNETAFSVRKPREVDVPEPVDNSTKPQDIRKPQSADERAKAFQEHLEKALEHSKWKYLIENRMNEPVVNSTEPQDIQRPPSADDYERAKAFQEHIEKALEHSKWKYLIVNRINETANHSLMKRRMRHINFVRSVIESSELQDIRRPPPALESITIREPREVDVAEPVVNSSAPQDARSSSPAVEPLVQSTEANDNDTLRPKRHVEVYGAPVTCVDCKQDGDEPEKSPIIHRLRELDVTGDWPLVDSWQLLDIRTTQPPSVLEFHDERRSKRHVEDRIELVNQYPIIVSTRKPRQVDVTEPSEGSTIPQDTRRPSPAMEALVEFPEVANDKRRPTRRIHEYSRVPRDDGDAAPLPENVFPGPPPSHPAYSMLPSGKPVQQFDIYHAPRGDRIIGDDSRNT